MAHPSTVSYRVQIVLRDYVPIFEDHLKGVFLYAGDIDILECREISIVVLHQCKATMLRDLFGIGDGAFEYGLPFSVETSGRALEGKCQSVAVELLKQGSAHAEADIVGAPAVKFRELKQDILDSEQVDSVALND